MLSQEERDIYQKIYFPKDAGEEERCEGCF